MVHSTERFVPPARPESRLASAVNRFLKLFAGLIAQSIQKESLVTQLREANAALIAHSYTDALTGLPNRRAIFEDLTTLFSWRGTLSVTPSSRSSIWMISS